MFQASIELPSGEVYEHVLLTAHVFFPPKHSEGGTDAPEDPFPGDFRLVHFEAMEMPYASAVGAAEEAVNKVWRVVNPEDTFYEAKGTLDTQSGTFHVESEHENPLGQFMTRTEQQEHIARAFTAVVRAVDSAMPRLYSAAFMECNERVIEVVEIPRTREDYRRLVDDVGVQMLVAESDGDLAKIEGTRLASERMVGQIVNHLKYDLEVS